MLEPTHNAPLAQLEQQLARLYAAVDRLLVIDQDLRRQLQERDKLIAAYQHRLGGVIETLEERGHGQE